MWLAQIYFYSTASREDYKLVHEGCLPGSHSTTMSQPMSKMVIVNGQIQRQGSASSTTATGGSSGEAPIWAGTVTVCGLTLPRWSIGALLLMALLLGGLKGLLVALFVGGAIFFSQASSSSPPPFTPSSAPRRGGGLSNVRGMGDLPKPVQKGG